MTTRIPCLKRIGENVKKYRLIDLSGKDEVTIGRSVEVSVCILSNMISRCHAILNKTDTGTWTVKDNKSLNGVFINRKRLEPQKAYELKEGDLVQIGVSTKTEEDPEFQFKYYSSMKVRQINRGCGEDAMDGAQAVRKRRKYNVDNEIPGASTGVTNSALSDSQLTSRPDINSRVANHSRKEEDPNYQQYKAKIAEQEELAKKKMEEYEQKFKEMDRLLKEKETTELEMQQKLEEEKKMRETQTKAVEAFKKIEEDLKQEFLSKQEALKEEMEARMKEELEDQINVKEANLLEFLETQKQTLMTEKQEIEERLHKELATALQEKDKKLEEELQEQKRKLEKVIENKELEQKVLESQLNRETKKEQDTNQAEVLQAKQEVLASFAQLMETELQCSICNELFVKATSLNCSHAFCSLCIAQWMKLKKECPVCRAPITTYMRSIVLDSYIDKMVEQLSEDMKHSRKEMIDERKQEEEKFEEKNRPKPPENPRGGPRVRAGRVRGRGRGRGRRGRGGNQAQPVEPAQPALPEPPVPPVPPVPGPSVRSAIMIDSSDDDDDDDDMYASLSDYEDSDEIDGDEGAYYGGYGRCYVCGSHGHWATGCPLR